MNGKKPNKQEREWLNKIYNYGCVVCMRQQGIHSPAEIHHINGGSNHLESIPLCYMHHREGGRTEEYASRHPFKAEFEKRYGTEKELLSYIRGLLC